MATTATCYGSDGIKRQIETIRDRMLTLGATYGLNDPKVLNASKELDALIVHYHKSKLNK